MASVDRWAHATQSHLSNVGELRHNVLKLLRQPGGGDASERSPQLGGPGVEDQLKRRQRTTQNLSASVNHNMEKIQYIIFQVRQCLANMSRRMTHMKAALSVVEMRLQLRENRPPSELVEDSFQEALQQEHITLLEALNETASKQEVGAEVLAALEGAKAEMHANRLTVHLDRSGHTQQILDRITELEKSAEQYCRGAFKMLEETERRTKKASAKTCSAMKQRIADTVELKKHIERDMQETTRTIAEVEMQFERMHRELVIHKNMPERQMSNAQGDFCNKKLSARTGALAELRAKIKAAAYTGTGGRRLDTLFLRFDRDGTGMLDEDEVRRALRTSCRIPPQVVSDAEISSLCQLLDEDRSGCVSISEIIDFICADCDVEALEEQLSWVKDGLESLRAAQNQSHIDLKNKIAAWKIDLDCSRVNPVKSLKLDTLPSPGRSRPATSSGSLYGSSPMSSPGRPSVGVHGTPRTPRTGLGSRASPRTPKADTLPSLTANTGQQTTTTGSKPNGTLDSATVDTLRSRMKAAAYTGTSGKHLEVVFKRFDKDGSGQLGVDEVRQAMRRILKIPPSIVSDADILALCMILDTDRSGSVNVKELVEFVGPEPTTSKRTGKTLGGQTLEPLSNGRYGGPPDESAGPPTATI